MSDTDSKPKAYLANRLYIRDDLVTKWHRKEYTYLFGPENSDNPEEFVEKRTYREFSSGYVGFARGNLQKIKDVFHDEFKIVDQRTLSPHNYDLQFTGVLTAEQTRCWAEWCEHQYGVIEAPPRWGKCLVGSSVLFTDRGLCPIEDLFDSVTGQDTVEHTSIKTSTLGGVAAASHKHSRKTDRTFKITTAHGFEVHGTPEHSVLTLDRELNVRWLPLEDIIPGQHWVAERVGTDLFSTENRSFGFDHKAVSAGLHHNAHVYPVPTEMTDDLARLLGYLVSEGSLKAGPITFTNEEQWMLDDFTRCFRGCFGVDPAAVVQPDRKPINLVKSSVFLKGYLEHVGLSFSGSAGMSVPWSVLRAPRKFIVAFLRAYFDGDGWFEQNKIAAVSASDRLIREIQLLLLNIGIVSTISNFKRASPVSGIVREYTKLRITGEYIDVFLREIGFTSPFKLRFSGKQRRRSTSTGVPFLGENLHAFMVKHMRRENGCRYDTVDGRKIRIDLGSIAHRGRLRKASIPSSYFADYPRMIEDIAAVDPQFATKLRQVSDTGIVWSSVTSKQEDCTPKMVYDLTVPETAAFVANGVVVHNTIFMCWMMCRLKQVSLVLAQEEQLLDQFEEEMRQFTNINELERKYGKKLIGKPKKADDVYPIATLSSWQFYDHNLRALRENRDRFGAVFVDEAHSASAPCFARVVNTTNSYYRIAVTATPKRKDGMHVIMFDVVGPVVTKGITEQLPVHVRVVKTGIAFPPSPLQGNAFWNQVLSRTMRHEKRNELICRRVMQDVKQGHSVLVVTDRIEHIYTLSMMLRKLVGQHIQKHGGKKIGIAELHGKLSAEQRRKIVNRFTTKEDKAAGRWFQINEIPRKKLRLDAKAGKIKIVIAFSKIVQLGWNVPAWSSLHSVMPMSNEPNWYQRISRIRTKCANCPGATHPDCLKKGLCEKRQPVCHVYVDHSRLSQGCFSTQQRVHERLGFVEQVEYEDLSVKVQRDPSRKGRTIRWDELS
jgi:intein/homing endonuclease